MKIIHRATVQNGRLIYKEPWRVQEDLKGFDGEVEVTIGKPRKQRTLPENSYYWAVPIKLISEHTGYTEDKIHNVLKELFLKKHIDIATSKGQKPFYIVRSTTELSTVEFEEYMSKIREWSSIELGVYIPDPSEVSY